MIERALREARKRLGLKQEEIARRAGLSRMTVQRIETAAIDPRLSTVVVLARALGMEVMLVPSAMRPAIEGYVLSGGRLVGQQPGVSAPPSIVDTLLPRPRSRS
jgi:transcriptional regulator with XRE-family HTH domain